MCPSVALLMWSRVSHWKNFPCLLFSFSEQSLRIPALVGMPCMRYLHCRISQQGVSLQLQFLCLGNICTALMAPHCHVGMQDGAANHQQSWWWHCLHEGKYAHLSEGQCPGCQIRSPQWSLRETALLCTASTSGLFLGGVIASWEGTVAGWIISATVH